MTTTPAPPRIAPVARRVAAFAIDLAVAVVVAAAVWLATREPVLAGLALVQVGVALCVWEGRTGLTLGNAACRIRTVRVEGPYAPGVRRSALRALVVGAGFLAAGLGQWVVVSSGAWDRRPLKQGWHDAVAGTVMIDVSPAPRGPGGQGGRGAQGQPLPVQQPHVQPWVQPAYPPAQQQGAGPQHSPGPQPVPVVPQPVLAPVQPVQAPVQPVQQPVLPPAPQRPAPVAGRMPVIQSVPGRTPAPQPAPAPVLVPALATVSAPAAPAAPAPAAPEPVQVAHAPAPTRAAARAAAQVGTLTGPHLLSFDNGQSFTVAGAGLIGRRPQATPQAPDAQLLEIVDEDRSVSKTHLQFGIDEQGFWVSDLGSTNGTAVLTPHGEPLDVVIGMRVYVPGDGSVRVGQRQFTARPAR